MKNFFLNNFNQKLYKNLYQIKTPSFFTNSFIWRIKTLTNLSFLKTKINKLFSCSLPQVCSIQNNQNDFNNFKTTPTILQTPSILLKKTSLNINNKSFYIKNTSIKGFSRLNKMFMVRNSKDTNRSQRGIFQGKRPGAGKTKSFSMKHTNRRFEVNTMRPKMHSDILNRDFYILMSKAALRTIKKYGSLDNYLLHMNEAKLKDSQYALYLRRILQSKVIRGQSEEAKKKQCKILGLKFWSQPRLRRKRRKEHKPVPSVVIPAELRRTDYSMHYYGPEKFISRTEIQEANEIIDELEKIGLDEERKKQLTSRLDSLLKLEERNVKFFEQVSAVNPRRHREIKDVFMSLRKNYSAKLYYIRALEHSEKLSKLILGDKYKHYAEDYPEVQKIIQELQAQFQQKELKNYQKDFLKPLDLDLEKEEGKPTEEQINTQNKERAVMPRTKVRQVIKGTQLKKLNKKKEEKIQRKIKRKSAEKLNLFEEEKKERKTKKMKDKGFMDIKFDKKTKQKANKKSKKHLNTDNTTEIIDV